ncbi:MAG: hypothetical protein JNK87_25800 [Bryobacterales bacterium]|nr:hypothetical protein [Bryobacterales bacterium]
MNQNPDPNPDPRRLLSGYATGNLSEAEAQELLQASLHDQELFDALADEQVLRDLLDQPGVKQELIESLRPSPWERFKKWMATPMGWSAAGVAVAAAALTLVIAPQAMRKAAEPVPHRVDQVAVTAPKEKDSAQVAAPPLVAQERRAPEPRAALEKLPPSKPAVERKEERAAPVASAPPPAPTEPAQQAYQAQTPVQAQQQQLADNADQLQRAEPRRQVATRVRDAAPKADSQAEQAAQAPAAPPAATAGALSRSQTAESVAVSATSPMLETAQPVYVLEAQDANGIFVAVRRPAPGRVRLRVNPAEDGFAVLQRNRETPLRVAVRKGVPALLPAEGLEVNTGDRLQLTFAYGQNLPGTTSGPAGFRAGASAKQTASPAPILIAIGAGTER